MLELKQKERRRKKEIQTPSVLKERGINGECAVLCKVTEGKNGCSEKEEAIYEKPNHGLVGNERTNYIV